MSNNEVDEVPLWSGVDKYDAVGNFDSFGVYLDQEPEKEVFIGNPIADTQRSYQWIYRDPIGIIQGPFTGLEMQGWYEAGFFEHNLHVKREDVPYFEPIDALILKVKNSKIPFLAPWPSNDSIFNNSLNVAPPQPPPISPFGNPPFASSRVARSTSPWENINNTTTTTTSSWLSHQNDPLYSTTTPRQRDNLYETDLDYQQLAMNKQMEQQYLTMLRQNQQHHILLQQRMVQQQQQQLLIQQQQQQRQQMFMNNQNYETIEPSMSRGWSSVPGTPGIVDTAQNPWSNRFSEPFVPSPPRRSRSRSPSKTQIEHDDALTFNHDDTLSFNLSSMSLNEPAEVAVAAEPVVNESPWVSQTAPIKTLREIQSEESTQSRKVLIYRYIYRNFFLLTFT